MEDRAATAPRRAQFAVHHLALLCSAVRRTRTIGSWIGYCHQVYNMIEVFVGQHFHLIQYRILQPLMLGILIDYFSGRSAYSKEEAAISAAGIVLTSIVACLAFHNYMAHCCRVGIGMRIVMISMIYKKVGSGILKFFCNFDDSLSGITFNQVEVRRRPQRSCDQPDGKRCGPIRFDRQFVGCFVERTPNAGGHELLHLSGGQLVWFVGRWRFAGVTSDAK